MRKEAIRKLPKGEALTEALCGCDTRNTVASDPNDYFFELSVPFPNLYLPLTMLMILHPML